MSTVFDAVVAKVKGYAPAFKKAVVAVARAAAVGAGVAALTVVAAEVPEAAEYFDLDPAATGQVTALVLLARDFLKSKGS